MVRLTERKSATTELGLWSELELAWAAAATSKTGAHSGTDQCLGCHLKSEGALNEVAKLERCC